MPTHANGCPTRPCWYHNALNERSHWAWCRVLNRMTPACWGTSCDPARHSPGRQHAT